MTESKRGCKKKSLIVVFLAMLMLISGAQFVTIVNAQDSWPFENPFSPLASFPLLRGEVKFAVFVPTLQNGEFERSENPKRDLKSFYKIKGGDAVFLDFMTRFQLGRFSSRTYFERREFLGNRVEAGTNADAALDYWGWRQGGDVDIFLGNKSRVGFNVDYSFYGPVFTIFSDMDTGARPTPPLKIKGPNQSWTLGAHAVYNPTWNIFGMSAIAEAWARWPIGGTSVTDYQVSGGLKWPDTVLGSFSVQAGYRSTSISFSEDSTGINATWDGVFGSISYYYH